MTLVTHTPPAAERVGAALSEEERVCLQRAAELQRPLGRCAAVASWSGRSLLALGALSAFTALLGQDGIGLFMGVGVAVLGVRELRFGRRVHAADVEAPACLGRNQLLLAGLITAYAAYHMLSASGTDPRLLLVSPEFAGQLDQLDGHFANLDRQLEELASTVFYGFYTLLILVSLGFQGGLARYYWRRRQAVCRYLEEAPAWARDTLADIGL